MIMEDNFLKKVLKGGAALGTASFLTRSFGIAGTLLTLHVLSVYEYGLYKLAAAAFGLLLTFRLSGIDSLVTADAARFRGEENHSRLRRLFLEYAAYQIGINGTLFLFSFFGASLLAAHFGAAIGGYVRILSLTFLVIPLERILSLLFNIHLQFEKMALFMTVEEGIKLAAVALLAWWLGWGLMGVFWARVLGSLGRFVFFAPSGVPLIKSFLSGGVRESANGFRPKFSQWEMVQMLRTHGKWGVASDYAGSFVDQARFWLIRFFTSTEAVGLYALADSMFAQVFSLLPLYELLFPIMPREVNNRRRLREIVLFALKYGTIAYGLACAVFFFAVPQFLAILFPRYLGAVPLFRIMLLAALTSAAANVTAAFFFAHRDQKTSFYLTLEQAALIFTLEPVLTWRWGIVGAAWSFVAVEILFIGTRLITLFTRYPDMAPAPSEFFSVREEERQVFSRMSDSIRKKITPRFLRGG